MAHALRMMVLLLLIGCSPALAWGLSIGQRDTFEDGTTDGWVVALGGAPHPAPPVNEPTGGPTGIGDNYLKLTAIGGSGPGSELVAINIGQWRGDFIEAGISGVAMDVKNFGPNDLSLRLVFSDPSGGPPVNVAFSTIPYFLPAGRGWISILFPITPADLTAGSGSVTAALHNTTALRLYDSADADFPGDPTVAVLGVDNITATPEPTSAVLLGSGPLALYSLKTWRGRKPRA